MAGRMPFSSSMPDMFDPYAAIRPAYMRATVQRPAAYYFLKTILIAGGIAGGLIALYRNDVFLELSRRVGQESRYFEAERYLGVTPGWGTPRSMQPVLEGSQGSAEQPIAAVTTALAERPVAAPTAEATPSGATTSALGATADAPPTNAPAEPTSNAPVAAATTESAPAAPVAAAPVAAAAEAPKPGFDPLAPVSLDSLPLLPRGARAPAAAPVAEAAPVAVSRPAASPSKARAAAVSLDEEADEPAPKRSRKVREAEPEPAPVAKAPKAPPEPKGVNTAPNPHDNPLTASIRAAVRARPAKD